jgi:hypothetical protein
MFAFILPVFLNIYFLIAGKNYSGSIINGPYTLVYLVTYCLEQAYKGKDLIVIHTTITPLFYNSFNRFAYPSWR